MSKHLISEDAGELIIEQEVTSEKTYNKKYEHPIRPGLESGITIGIGYDCGYSTPDGIRRDWKGRIPDSMIEILATRCAGLKGANAQNRLAEVKSKIVVPWEAAISEFYEVEVPRWIKKVKAALPNVDKLSPDCIGALVSLAYNRGPSFTIPASKDPKGRYAEMRNIRVYMGTEQYEKIPNEFRKMKRIWANTSNRGLLTRREEEAKLFERGLKAMNAAQRFVDADADPDESDQTSARQPTLDHDDSTVAAGPETDFDDHIEDATPIAPSDAPPNVQPVDRSVRGDPILYDVQVRLKARRYPPGLLDGKWGSGTRGALSGFMNDRGMTIPVPTSTREFRGVAEEIRAELAAAETEPQADGSIGWFRPVSEARAKADPKIVKELAPETIPVKRNFLITIWGSVAAFFGAIWDTVSSYVSSAYDFFTDHQDVVDNHPGVMSTVWEYVGKVPIPVWCALAGVVLLFIALNSRSAIKTSILAVQNGERQ